jgi:DNA-binding transcriptional ArsR family regulator
MKSRTLPMSYLEKMAGVLRILGHAYRLRIVERLDLRGPAAGHRLLAELGGAQGALSQHLNKLRIAGVIRAERRGKEVWYGLASPDALTILNCMRKRRRGSPPR